MRERPLRTQVAIVGAGPAGLLLAHDLHRRGVASIVIESRSREQVAARVRAGVLEPVTVKLLADLGLDERLRKEGLVHTGVNLRRDGETLRIDLADLTGGSGVVVYGQSEVMADLTSAADARGLDVRYECQGARLQDLDGDRPSVTFTQNGADQRVDCDFIAGCDGSHGASRASLPEGAIRLFETAYPFGWLGVLADVPPAKGELIYASHERGFALASMRSARRSRYYIQCALSDRLEDWPDDRFWDETCIRLGPVDGARVTRGPSTEKSIAPLRSLVAEPMRCGRLFLAGDAAHTLPPTGAKGLNLAASDVVMLGEALAEHCRSGKSGGVESYSERALARVWKAERFAWWLTMLTHRFPDASNTDRRHQAAEFAYLRSSRAAQTMLAENYVGLPMA